MMMSTESHKRTHLNEKDDKNHITDMENFFEKGKLRADEITFLLKEKIKTQYMYGDLKFGKISVGLTNMIGTFNPLPEVGWGDYKWNLLLEGNEFLNNVKKLEVHLVFHILEDSKNKISRNDNVVKCIALMPSDECKAFSECNYNNEENKSTSECQRLREIAKNDENDEYWIKINNCPYSIPLIYTNYDVSKFNTCITNFTEPKKIKENNLQWLEDKLSDIKFHTEIPENRVSKTSNIYVATWEFEDINLKPDYKGVACGTAIFNFDSKCNEIEIPISIHAKFSFSGETSLWKTITPEKIIHFVKPNEKHELVIIPAYRHVNPNNVKRGLEEYESDWDIGLLMKTGIPNVSLRSITLYNILNKFKNVPEYYRMMNEVGKEIGHNFGNNFWNHVMDEYLFENGIKDSKYDILFLQCLKLWARYDANAGMGLFKFGDLDKNNNFTIDLINSFLVLYEHNSDVQCSFLKGYFEGVIDILAPKYFDSYDHLEIDEIECAAQNEELMERISLEHYTETNKYYNSLLSKEKVCEFEAKIIL